VPSIDVVILDVDGTVADCPIDFGRMRAEVRTIAARWGVDTGGLAVRGVIEQVRAVTGALGDKGEGFRREAERAVEAIEVEAARRARLLPGAPEALAELHRSGVAIALVTRNCRAAAEIVLRDVTSYDVLLTRDDVPAPKPDPDHIHRSLAALGGTADRAAMVGDYDFDMLAGRAAGVQVCIGVRTGGGTDRSLTEAGADVILDSLAEVPAWLRHRSGAAR